MKRFFVAFLIGWLAFIPLSAKAEDDIDLSEPIRVKLIGEKDDNVYTVSYNDKTFDVSMIGIDLVKEYTTIEYVKTGKNDEVKENPVIHKETEIYHDLLQHHDIVIELDKEASTYNNDGIVQAWIWADGQLMQAKFVGDGRARIDEELCDYAKCDTHYEIMKLEQEYAKRQGYGLHSAEKVKYVEYVGGNKDMKNFNLDSIPKEYLYIGLGVIGLLLLIIIIVLIVSGGKKKKKRKMAAAIKTEKISNASAENSAEKGDSAEKIAEQPAEKPKDNADVTDFIEGINKELTDDKEINEVLSFNEENVRNNAEPVLEAMPSKKVLLLKATTLPVNDGSIPEIIRLEYMISGVTSSYRNIDVKPMRSASEVEDAYLFEEAIQTLIEDARDCEKVYVWGNSSISNLLCDAETKLSDSDFNRLNYLLAKAVNYKEVFADNYGINPCGLIKAIEKLGLAPDDSQIKMMDTLYQNDDKLR